MQRFVEKNGGWIFFRCKTTGGFSKAWREDLFGEETKILEKNNVFWWFFGGPDKNQLLPFVTRNDHPNGGHEQPLKRSRKTYTPPRKKYVARKNLVYMIGYTAQLYFEISHKP